MKPLLIFLLLFVSAAFCDIRPFDTDMIRRDTITVTVRGEVEEEGQLELPLYSTVGEALAKAGLQEDADTDDLNPQTILKDHDVINVRKKEETRKVSINSSGVDELCLLPGIGESTAARIIRYRDENGLFREIDDLTQVKGIGEAKLARIRDLITL